MTVNAYYEQELANSVVGDLVKFASNNTELVEIKQNYKGNVYQNVRAARIPQDTNVMSIIKGCFLHFNDVFFKYDLFDTFEAQLLKYSAGHQYDWHADYGISENPAGDRKISMSIQLSSAWEYNGGDLVIRDWYNREKFMTKDIGHVIAFDSRCPHKVQPILDGERIAIVAWAHGPQLR